MVVMPPFTVIPSGQLVLSSIAEPYDLHLSHSRSSFNAILQTPALEFLILVCGHS